MSKPTLAVIVDGELAAAGPGDKDNIEGLGTAATRNVGISAEEIRQNSENDEHFVSKSQIKVTTGQSSDGIMSQKATTDALATKVDNDDPRLTDSREWSEDTVSQAEAEEGTASTRRAWTAQRVRQAAVAWWNGITSAFGRGFVASADAAQGRTALGLGTAATRDVGTEANQLIPSNVFFSSLQNAGVLETPNADYEYDALGRVDKIVTPDGDTLIGYDLDGRAETITYPTGRVETYTYDASGNVTSMTATGG